MGVIASDFDELSKWIADDQPVSHPRLDAFGRNAIAERIASVLVSTDDSHQTIALVGELGAGKSTILNLTTYHLIKNKSIGARVAIIPVSLWPFDSVEAAVRGMLAPLSDGLARHVNISPIAGLPDEYINAIESTGQGWARLLGGPKSPSAVLGGYDKIATAIGLRVVLWVEDIERFAGTAFSANTPEVERLEPIRSLLNLLSEFKSIRVVLASASLSTRFDIEKFARIVELIPLPDTSSIWKVLNCFRGNHLQRSMDKGLIDPASKQVREPLNGLGGSLEYSASAMLGWMSPAMALALLCSNPRRLKYGLRHCQEAWRRLEGEIDFDDILLISALRAAEPDVFSLVNRYIEELRDDHPSKDDGAERPSAFAVELDALIGKSSGSRRAAIEAVLNFVFPGWEAQTGSHRHQKPQGLALKTHRDYWVRYLSPSLISDDEKDQRVLRAIIAWKEKRSDDLVKMLVAEDQSSAIKEFSRTLLDRKDLLILLEEVTMTEKARSSEAPIKHAPESFRSIENMMLHQHPGEQELASTLKKLLAEIIPIRLQLAYFLMEYFAKSSRQNLLDRGRRHEVQVEFESLLLRSFAPDGAERLINSVRGGISSLIYRCSWGAERIQRGDTSGLPFDAWPTFSGVLLGAAELDTDLMLPQVIPFLVNAADQIEFDGSEHSTRRVYSLNEDAFRLFDRNRLVDLIQKKDLSKFTEQWIQQAYQVIRQSISQQPPPASPVQTHSHKEKKRSPRKRK
ncbi:P-loop NTPase fold protein [Cystobacter ferrugineus]|uniref:P-loop NTPase fold protein n=1 Tax=Cystobacter ferrugineus TaxID=83449 RepID=UPI00090409B4|nr:P-loop NTPase fold protein [Cystobacter ferrugineus]